MPGPITKKQMAKFDIMMFDGVCNFCSGSVLFSLPRLANPGVRFCPMQSGVGQATLKKFGFPADNFETFIYISKGKLHTKSDGVIRLSQNLKAPWPFLGKVLGFIPKGFRDWLYLLIARHRYKIMGKKKQCMVPDQNTAKFFIL